MALILYPICCINWLKKQWPEDRANKAIWFAQYLWEKHRDSSPSFERQMNISQIKSKEKEKKKEVSVFKWIKKQRVLNS